MKANAKVTAAEIAGGGWVFNTDENGSVGDSTLKMAALLDIASSARGIREVLRSINVKLDALGSDGIHFVIREQAKKLRRQEKERRARAKARKAARSTS